MRDGAAATHHALALNPNHSISEDDAVVVSQGGSVTFVPGGRGETAYAFSVVHFVELSSTSEIQSKESGFGPIRPASPRSNASIGTTSSADNSKSKSCKFSSIRSRCADFGMTMSPCWMCQRKMICAAVLPCAVKMPDLYLSDLRVRHRPLESQEALARELDLRQLGREEPI